MTNSTEKLKKGKLPEGLYWVKHDGVINILDDLEISLTNVEQILGKVPSFEEYQKLLSDQLAKNEGVEINAELEAENTKLKELLKECKPYVRSHDYWNKAQYDEIFRIVKQIDEFLGEE